MSVYQPMLSRLWRTGRPVQSYDDIPSYCSGLMLLYSRSCTRLFSPVLIRTSTVRCIRY